MHAQVKEQMLSSVTKAVALQYSVLYALYLLLPPSLEKRKKKAAKLCLLNPKSVKSRVYCIIVFFLHMSKFSSTYQLSHVAMKSSHAIGHVNAE
jgi:hypothetical protein